MKKINGDTVLAEGLKKLKIDLSTLVAETSLWVHPSTCNELRERTGTTTRYPNCRRGRCDEGKGESNGVRIDDNTYANRAIKRAIVKDIRKISNFHTCHIYDETCYDVRYHTKYENLVLLPSAIAQLSDYSDEIKEILKYRSFELYDWYPEECEEPKKPVNYPVNWREPVKNNTSVTKEEKEIEDLNSKLEDDRNDFIEKEYKEIEKVQRKLPKWVSKKGQINSIILYSFFDLFNNNDNVSKIELKEKCAHYVNDFDGNFNQMAHYGEKNHGKIFTVDGDKISLWEPVKDFIIGYFERNKIVQ